jgi:predicted phosphodiesterase
MRIAAIADVHGNLKALEAVLDNVATKHFDETIFVGDLIMGAPDCKDCWRLASSHGPCVLGNAEERVGKFGTPDEDSEWAGERYGPLRWSAEQFTGEERELLAGLPMTLRVQEAEDLVFFHATPHGFRSSQAYTPAEKLHDFFSGVTEHYLVRGHQHNPQVRLWDGRVIINCGSAGAQVDMNHDAQYLILDQRDGGWDIQHQSVPYDVEAAVQRFTDSGYLEATGPMGRLYMRQVATATGQIPPFLHYYASWSSESDISLADAVDRFLNFC